MSTPLRRAALLVALEGYLAWKITEVIPRFAGMPKPDHALRRPLTETLGGQGV